MQPRRSAWSSRALARWRRSSACSRSPGCGRDDDDDGGGGGGELATGPGFDGTTIKLGVITPRAARWR